MSSRCSPRYGFASNASAVLLVGLLSACVDGSSAPELQITNHSDQTLSRIYRLGIGDKLKITVFGEQELSGSFEVNATGTIPLPLIGDIQAKGRAIPEFRDSVARKLSEGYLKNPKVTVEVVNYRPIYVHGEVRSGGEFQFKTGLKIRDAIAIAGGFSYRADQSYVLLTREGQAQEAKVRMAGDAEVLPGDNIRVPERFF